MTELSSQRCGYVAIVGRPNVGKSTLMNHLIGFKVSAIANKPQTTRHSIRGILTEGDYQMIFVDTPGIHRTSKSLLNKTINREAVASIEGVDAVVMIVEAMRWQDEDNLVLERIAHVQCPVFLIANKVDKIEKKEKLFGWLPEVLSKYPFKEIFPLSATKGTNTEQLKNALAKVMPQQDWIYAEDDVTDQSTRFICGELIREQLMTYLHQEMPYSTAVEIETFTEKPHITEINAVIWVSRENQKGIVIGSKGDTLKRIGSSARIALEAFLERKVMLKLWVRVEENWENSPRHLQSLGIST
ncbi:MULTISPECIES: GTPase Era [Thiothrix]|jgi:GTP-binding protein Era|uniref:GTPase Era n=1 Tax=Thiothrix unzii TaxID=111769 RepID=A0A975FCC3_9GAMM|nr:MULTISPECIES: GTPase Era [Thiothrix]MDX9988930.1 GTPase Era [Thiothrix unzii]QTR54958.1 GTPase Era [Thiothrix unzii]